MTVETMSLQEKLDLLKKEIPKMQRNFTHGSKKPHKLVMLLAVLDLFDREVITENKIYFNNDLIWSFSNIFNLIRSNRDSDQPAPPFFHLRTSSFWKHKIKDGREVPYSKLSTSGGGSKRIEEYIEYAYLSNEIYSLFSDADAHQGTREFLISLLNPLPNFENLAPLNRSTQKRGK